MSTSSSPAEKVNTVFPVLLAIVLGASVALQSRTNSELAKRSGDPFFASAASFSVGTVLITLAVALLPAGRRGLHRAWHAFRHDRQPFWLFLGGLSGSWLVLTQTFTVGPLGVALFTVAIVAGQTSSGLLIDRIGMGNMPAKPFTARRLVGAALALIAVLIAAVPRLRQDIPLVLMVLPLIAGCLMAYQQAANGQVRHLSNSMLAATFINFQIGGAVLVGIFVVRALLHLGHTSYPTTWWLYSGGLVGLAYIAGNTIVVRMVGVLVTVMSSLCGQLAASIALDLVWPGGSGHVTGLTIVGAALTLLAVTIASQPTRLPWRRR